MESFMQTTFKPEIFWTALAAISTTAAVIIALFQPIVTNKIHKKKISKLIMVEIKDNYQKITQIAKLENSVRIGGTQISRIQIVDGISNHINLSVWDQYKYQLAAYDPELYLEYTKINRCAESIVKESQHPDALRLKLRQDEAKSFVEQYKTIFGNNA